MSIDLFALFVRLFVFFLLSPLFVGRGIPLLLRFALTIGVFLVLAPPLAAFPTLGEPALLYLVVREAAIGYILGFLVSLLLEGALLAGQIVGTMAGFSATELLNPLANRAPLIGKTFLLIVATLLLALDFHHAILRLLFESFTIAPSPAGIIDASAQFFIEALKFAALPMATLSGIILLFAVAARLLPEVPIFWIGFPVQLIVGFVLLILSLNFFSDLVTEAFTTWLEGLKKILPL